MQDDQFGRKGGDKNGIDITGTLMLVAWKK